MKVAIIETPFLEEHVKKVIQDIKPPFETDYYNYENFLTVGRLYTELCNDYDGFLTSGPLPLTAIKRYVGDFIKPIVSFGLDATSYYETFFRIQYEQNDPYFEKGYFDLQDMQPERFELSQVLREGTFWDKMLRCYKYTSGFTISEFSSMEERLAKKHISLYRNGNTCYSVTRLSSIMPKLLEAGIPVYFIYPSYQVLKSAANELITNVKLSNIIRQCSVENEAFEASSSLLGAASSEGPANAADISGKSGISVYTITKVMKAIDAAGTNKFTSKALAAAMDINIRSANRVLSKLTEAGLADIVSEQVFGRKGRPELVYRIFQGMNTPLLQNKD